LDSASLFAPTEHENETGRSEGTWMSILDKGVEKHSCAVPNLLMTPKLESMCVAFSVWNASLLVLKRRIAVIVSIQNHQQCLREQN